MLIQVHHLKRSLPVIVVSEIHKGDSIAAEEVANPLPNSQITRSLTTAAEPSHGGKDEPDVGVNKYIAQMRARGHKRSSSAPISYQPPPPPPSPDPQTQGEGVGKTVKGREEIVSPLYETLVACVCLKEVSFISLSCDPYWLSASSLNSPLLCKVSITGSESVLGMRLYHCYVIFPRDVYVPYPFCTCCSYVANLLSLLQSSVFLTATTHYTHSPQFWVIHGPSRGSITGDMLTTHTFKSRTA